jgi:DNA-binding transcriptional ArsR family regulator
VTFEGRLVDVDGMPREKELVAGPAAGSLGRPRDSYAVYLAATTADDVVCFPHGAFPGSTALDIYAYISILATMKLKADLMAGAADRASELLKALANRHRLLILCQLIESERSVGELAEFLGIRDSGVSQHLALLRKDGLVATRRDGQTIWYSIASAEARALLTTLYGIYCQPTGTCEANPTRKMTGPARRRLERGQ